MTPFKSTNRITSPYGWRTYTNNAGVTIREHHNGIDVVPTRYAGDGGGAGHENMPPYKAVYIWQRTA